MPRPKKSSYGEDKPPYSYVALCVMAIHSSPAKMMTLSQIYKFIVDNFSFYKNNGMRWQNSLRHNLSFNDCFVKVYKTSEDGVKRSYWALHKDASQMFENGSFLRRKKRFSTSNDMIVKSASVNKSIPCDHHQQLHTHNCRYISNPPYHYLPVLKHSRELQQRRERPKFKSFSIKDILDIQTETDDLYANNKLNAYPSHCSRQINGWYYHEERLIN